MIRVVKLNSARDNFSLYIGRDWADMKESIYHNPFHVGKDGDRIDVLLKFAIYWYSPEQKGLRECALLEFSSDETLGCWCKPLECHGDIEAGYVEWKRSEAQLSL